MKAMILREPGPVEENPLEEIEIAMPATGAYDVCIRVYACGVCHTDLHTVEGELKQKISPLIPGHQIVGKVEEVGSNVKRFRTGDRVGVCWLNSACGQWTIASRG